MEPGEFPCTTSSESEHSWPSSQANREGPTLRKWFGLVAPVKVAGGALKFKDEVKLTFDLVARKQG